MRYGFYASFARFIGMQHALAHLFRSLDVGILLMVAMGLGAAPSEAGDFHRELHSLCWDPNIHSPVQLRVHSSVPATYPGLEGVTTFVQSPLDMWHVRNTRHQTWLAGKSPWPSHAGFDGKNHLSMGDFPSRHVCRLPWAIHAVALDGLGEGTSTKVGNPQTQGISEAMTLEILRWSIKCVPLFLYLCLTFSLYIYYMCVYWILIYV